MKRTCIWVGVILIAGLAWMAQSQVRAEPVTLPVFSATEPTCTTVPPPETVEFPCVLGAPGLIVTDIVCFEGLTPEAGEEMYVTDALALLIYNPGRTGIRSATITMTRGNETLYFDLEYLPGGNRVLVVERNYSAYGDGRFDSCQCEAFVKEYFAPEIPDVQIREENGRLTVENLTDAPLPSLTVYYKPYTHHDGFYIGGTAMSVWFGFLQPGETATQKADGYASGYSRVAAVIIGE